jgi:hypothetical protein
MAMASEAPTPQQQRRLASVLRLMDEARSQQQLLLLPSPSPSPWPQPAVGGADGGAAGLTGPGCGLGTLQTRGCLHLVVRFVGAGDALCCALACRALRAAVEREYPPVQALDGKRYATTVAAVAGSVNRLCWARDIVGRGGAAATGALQLEGPPWLTSWDASTCAVLARAGQLMALQWVRAGGDSTGSRDPLARRLCQQTYTQRLSAPPPESLVAFVKRNHHAWLAWHLAQNLGQRNHDPRKHSHAVLERFRCYMLAAAEQSELSSTRGHRHMPAPAAAQTKTYHNVLESPGAEEGARQQVASSCCPCPWDVSRAFPS